MRKVLNKVLASLLCLLLSITGSICSPFDPLPSRVRNAISSNHLGEGGSHVFAEYHALLPNFRGDFGVKSDIVNKATQEPVYAGADTVVVPLYIPHGAIPIQMHERIPRSGPSRSNFRILGGPSPAVPGVSSRVALNRPLSRRSGTPSRRTVGGPRKIPTPPQSFLRPWMKRRTVELASKVPDNVDAAHRSKVLSHVADFRRRIDVSSQDNTTTPRSTTQLIDKKSTNQTVAPDTMMAESIFVKNTTDSMELDDNVSVFSIVPVRLTTPMSVETTVSTTPSPTPKRSIGVSRSNSRLSIRNKKRRVARPIHTTPFITSSTLTSTQPPLVASKKPTVESSRTSTLSIETTTQSTTTTTTESTTTTTTQATTTPPSIDIGRGHGSFRIPVWPRRRLPLIPKVPQAVKERLEAAESKEDQRQNEDIIDRVLSSAAVQSESLPKDINSVKPSEAVLLNTTNKMSIFDRVINNASSLSPLENQSPLSKVHNSSVEQATPEPIDSQPNVTERVTTRVKGLPIASLNAHKHAISKTSFENPSHEAYKTTINEYSTNSITTSTPKLPWQISSRPSIRQRVTTNKLGQVVRTFNLPPSRKRYYHSSSSRLPFAVSTPKMKSAQDIVLEKLSTLMTVSAESGKQSLEEIAREIEIINDELSALGIHIIDAEFDGHKLQLTKPDHSVSTPQTPVTESSVLEQFSVSLTPRPTVTMHRHKTDEHRDVQEFLDDLSEREDTNDAPVNFVLQEKPTSQSTVFSSPVTTNVHKTLTPHQSDLPDYNSGRWRGSSLIHSTVTKDLDRSSIRPSTVVSSTKTTRTRSTLIPVTPRIIDQIVPSPNIDEFLEDQSTSLEDDAFNKDKNNRRRINPTSHFRPILRNIDETSSEVSEEDETVGLTDGHSRSTNLSSVLTSSTVPTPLTSEASTEGASIDVLTQSVAPNVDVPEASKPMVKSTPQHRHNEESLPDKTSSGIKNETILLLEVNESTQPEIVENHTSSYVYFAGLLGVIPFGIILLVFLRSRYKPPQKSLPEREERADGNTPPIHHVRSSKHAGTLDALPAYVLEKSETRPSPWELPRSKLRITGIIGEGNFGMVWKAEARNLCDWESGGGPTVLVAVKGVKENAGLKEKTDLLKELAIMQIAGQHDNIVTLLGCCTTHEPYYLVMEYVMFGKLLTFLRESRSKNNYFNFSSDTDHLTSKDLTRFAHQIATGCEYLQSKGVIHRDLAARNILLDHNKTCKVADFGLARSVKDQDSDIYEQKSRGPLPIRWMAPESLYMNIYTPKSDVWSFGIACWEIVTLGSTPYPGISAREVMRRVREGYRLERPEHCRSEFYRIIASCWTQDHNKRPAFHALKNELRDLLDQKEGWIDLENFQESTYYSMHENNEEKL